MTRGNEFLAGAEPAAAKAALGKVMKETIIELGGVLGLTFGKRELSAERVGEIERRIAERDEARKSKDFKRADAIRAELLDQGIVLEDEKKGTVWRVRS